MTREHKIGIAVTCTFLCLTGAVIGLKMQDDPAPANPPEDKTASVVLPDPTPEGKKPFFTPEDAVGKVASNNLSPGTPQPRKDKKTSDEPPALTPPPPIKDPSAGQFGQYNPSKDSPPSLTPAEADGSKLPPPSQGAKLVQTSSPPEKLGPTDKKDNKPLDSGKSPTAKLDPPSTVGPIEGDKLKGAPSANNSTGKENPETPIMMMGGFAGAGGTPAAPVMKDKDTPKPSGSLPAPIAKEKLDKPEPLPLGPGPEAKSASTLVNTPDPVSPATKNPFPPGGVTPPLPTGTGVGAGAPALAGAGSKPLDPKSPTTSASTTPPAKAEGSGSLMLFNTPPSPPPPPPSAPLGTSSTASGAPSPLPSTPSPVVVPLSGSPSSPPKTDEAPPAKKPDAPASGLSVPSDPTAKPDQNPKDVSPKPADTTPTFSPLSPGSEATKPVTSTSPPLAPAPAPAPAPSSLTPPAPPPTVKPPAEGTYFIPDTSSGNPGGSASGGSKPVGAIPAPLPAPPLPVVTPPGGAPATDAGRIKPIATGSPPALTKPAPRTDPQVVVYDEQEYVCQPNDDFKKISAKYYKSEQYADALQRHNQQHARASDRMAHEGTIAAGEKIYIPQAYILEERYGDAIVKPATPPSPTVPASFSAPAGSTPLPAPGPAGSTGFPPR